MIVELLGPRPGYNPVERLQATPICGEDFCDDCGDCLACYWEDPCRDERGHVWCVYAECVDEWRSLHPEAKPPAE